MANIKKNFNFRNGVQVDDDNLLVTDTGLVGIGTTIPNEALDVRGNVVVTGFTSTTTAQIGVLTVTTFIPNQITGAGLSVFSGIVTAQGAGILTYFGDARNLQGMPTSQWEDKDVGLGFTSIYNTGGNVGVGTEDPRSTFQVGNNADAGEKGVGISSVGNINATGIVTAPSFIGNLTGDVTGRITGDLVGNINSAGVSTFAGGINLGDNDKIQFGNNQDAEIFHDASAGINDFRIIDKVGHLKLETATNKDIVLRTGVTTLTNLKAVATQGVELYFSGDKKLETASSGVNVVGTTTTGQLSVTGVSTFGGVIEAPAGMNKVPSLYMNQSNLPSASNYHGMFAHVHSTGRGYFAHAMNWYELVNKDLFGVVGTGTERYNIGVSTISNLIVSGIATFNHNIDAGFVGASSTSFALKMGVGTTEAPVNDIQVRKSGDAEIQITSETGSAGLTVGRETGNLDTNNAEFRYGEVSAGSPYSSAQSLDILNYGTGNFNYHISANNAGAIDGDFHWHKGKNSARLMTLTGIGGSLGIGKTQPTTELDVEGAGNFTGNLAVGANLNVGGTVIGNVQGTLIGNVQGTLAGNTNATSGISTLNNITVAGVLTATTGVQATSLGVAVAPDSDNVFRVNGNVGDRFFIGSTGTIGIKTTSSLTNVTINASQANASIAAVAVGATVLKSAVDFADAGTTVSRFMIPPKVTTSQRNSLNGVVAGAMIYNTSTNTLQFYNGSGWRNVSSTAV